MATVKAILMLKKAKGDGTCPIWIRLSEGTKNKYYSSKLWVLPKEWDIESEQIRKNHPNYEYMNALLLKKRNEINNEVIGALVRSEKSVIRAVREGRKERGMGYFFKEAQNYLKELAESSKFTRLSGDKAKINNFYAFIGQDITFKEIDLTLLRKFALHLRNNRKVNERTVMNYMIVIRTVYNRAIQDGLADSNDYPFGKRGMRIKLPESEKIGLNVHEVTLLEKAFFKDKPVWNHVKNVWLFSFYLAGIRISDALRLRWKDVIDDRLVYQMGKNKKTVSLKLPDKAMDILKQYERQKIANHGYVFPELRNTMQEDHRGQYLKITQATGKFDKVLKEIGKDLGIEKKLSCHISRHTFGNITKDKISPQMLQKLYRHSDIRTTMGYQANFIHTDVDHALEKVLDY